MRQVKPSKRNPIKAIRRHCVDCCGGAYALVESCPSADCALWPFRMGKNPFRTSTPAEMKTRILSADTHPGDACHAK